MRKRPLILVEWEDITGNYGWEDESADFAKKVITVSTTGWQLKSDRKHLVITSSRTSKKECDDRSIIPRGCIKKITRLQ